MRVKDHQFPVVVQAYTPNTDQDVFVAEQVVHTQAEVDIFTSRYAGKLIKTRHLTDSEIDTLPKNYKETHPQYKRSRSSAPAGRIIMDNHYPYHCGYCYWFYNGMDTTHIPS
ncbi:MAG: hypothetical protein JWN76_2750 [Chitinophagaceae bacterium]|nr:hypothetical protein [Chitinophagaceae bacterium]